MIEPETTSKPICELLAINPKIAELCMYHPQIASSAVDEPSRNLASSLDDQQTAEPLRQLEKRSRVSEEFVPRPNCQHL